MIPNEDDSFVEPQDACPGCGERHTDNLLWLDDERVKCQMCGAVYTPNAAKPGPDPRR